MAATAAWSSASWAIRTILGGSGDVPASMSPGGVGRSKRKVGSRPIRPPLRDECQVLQRLDNAVPVRETGLNPFEEEVL